MFLLHQVNLGPNEILRSECVQNRGKFESIVEMIKRANLLVWRKCVIAYTKHRFISVFFQERQTNCRFAYFFLIFAFGVAQLLRLLATTCFQTLHLKLLLSIEDKHERPQ